MNMILFYDVVFPVSIFSMKFETSSYLKTDFIFIRIMSLKNKEKMSDCFYNLPRTAEEASQIMDNFTFGLESQENIPTDVWTLLSYCHNTFGIPYPCIIKHS